MTWVTVFPLRTAAIGMCTPRHFCLGETPFFALELRGLVKSKMPTSRGKNGGHVPLESVTHVIRLSQQPVLPNPQRARFSQPSGNVELATAGDLSSQLGV